MEMRMHLVHQRRTSVVVLLDLRVHHAIPSAMSENLFDGGIEMEVSVCVRGAATAYTPASYGCPADRNRRLLLKADDERVGAQITDLVEELDLLALGDPRRQRDDP